MTAHRSTADRSARPTEPPGSRDRALFLMLVTISFVCVGLAVWSANIGAQAFLHPAYEGTMQPTTARGARWFAGALVGFAVILPLAGWWLIRSSRPRAISTGDVWGPLRSVVVQVMLMIVLLGALPRAHRLTESPWYDEIAALVGFAQHGPGVIVGNFFDPANHIFHTLLTWMALPFAELLPFQIAIRVPAFLFSVATIPVVGALGAIIDRPRTGLIASAIAAITPVVVLEAANARGYSMVIFFSAASTLLLLRSIDRDRPAMYLSYAILTALGVWTHFVFAILAVGHAVCLVYLLVRGLGVGAVGSSRGACVRGLGAVVLAGCASLVLYAPVLPDFLRLLFERSMFDAAQDTQPTIIGAEGLHMLFMIGGTWSWWASIPGWCLLIAGVSAMIHRGDRATTDEVDPAIDDEAQPTDAQRVRLVEGVLLTLVGLVVFLAIVALAGTWVYARFAFFAMPGVIVLMAIGARWMLERSRRLAATLLLALAVTGATDLIVRPARQPLARAVSYVVSRTESSAPSVRNAPAFAVGLRHRVIFALWPNNAPPLAFSSVDDAQLGDQIGQVEPHFVIVYYPHLLEDAHPGLLKSLGYERVLHLSGWQDWGRGDVEVYERIEGASTGSND